MLKKANKVLLLKRFNTGYQNGKYSMVAGHLDSDETVREAMKREAKEEAGIDLDSNSLSIAHILHRNTPDREYVDFFLTTDKWRGQIRNTEPEKCSELGWFDINNLPENTIDYIAKVLERIGRGEFFSEYGFKSK